MIKGLQKEKNSHRILYVATIILSALFLFIGHRIATSRLTIFNQDNTGEEIVKARVVKIIDKHTDEYNVDGHTILNSLYITFTAEILNGTHDGEIVTAVQSIDNMHYDTPEIEQSDKILLLYASMDGQEWQFIEFIKTDKLLIFSFLFIISLLIFGRKKGFNTILSLVFTCSAIFAVFIPAILSGRNIYISSILVCIFTIVMTFLIVNGFNKKTLAASVGCFGGITVSALLTLIMDKVLVLTGLTDEEAMYLTYLPIDSPINLNAIIFAAIIIGALGAIMDVSMSISSSLWEVKEKVKTSTRNDIFRSGINIGRDIMGTMANTLILAYIGSSLSIVLLLSVYSTSLIYLLNREMIVVEILKALVGSFGILITVPLTSLICAVIYTKEKIKTIKIKRIFSA